ncbi:hypothetical protein HF086_001733 [Spodoptera exigua]|uniref:Uncharacterized protein n=1 Tax=Spodoptera exigua TaxID=7107 RepID=A0A922M016_SPOEX|nr:hypothetical protein HF086_001733 [Spodoptera exigua]
MSALSRKKRILNLALQMDENNYSDPTTNRNNNEERNNIESAVERGSNTSSPLPSNAQNIIVEMAEVYHAVFDDTYHTGVPELQVEVTEKNTHTTSQQVISLTQNKITTISEKQYDITENLITKTSHQVATTPPFSEDPYPEEELTPLNIEVTSSFNNSPALYLEEFEEPAVATPSTSQITLATPMPSPINVHRKCDDDFCPDHSSWIDSIQSEGTSGSTLTQQKKRRSRKRLVNKDNWSDVKRKYLKNLGKSYVSKRGKFVEDKVMGKPCNCRYKCTEKITEDQRLECFTRFWKLGSTEKQWRFVAKYVKRAPKNRCLNRSTPNNRQFTLKYFLPVKSLNADVTSINVCKTMFLKTLAVSESIIKTTFKKYDGVADFEEDYRGKHNHHKSIINNDMIKSVCDHVNSFVPVESHFIRKDSTKLYLDGSLSISRMFRMYSEWFDQNIYASKATTVRQYREIVNKNFNLGFHVPKKDQCEVCHVFTNNRTPTNEEIQKHKVHMDAKKIARAMKQKDKHDAIESQGSIVTAVFDFQKVLTCPHGQISIFYYKRKLSAYNFTVFNMGQKKAVCYMWDETVAKRGANEVGKGEPYLVKNMLQEKFFNFKTHVNDKLWNKNLRKQKILWTKVKEVFVDKSETNKLYFKYDLNEESYECLVIRNDTRNSSVLPALERAYSSPLKLTKDKYNDLESMCRSGVINATNAIFFRSLPYKCNYANEDLSDESDE